MQAYLEGARWPEGVRCLKCDSDKVSNFVTNETTRERVNRKGQKVTVKVPARHLYQCLNPECSYQFSATTGTLFNDTHLPLTKWFLAIALMCNAKKDSLQSRWNGPRRQLSDGVVSLSPHPQVYGRRHVTEVDETHVGGQFDRRRHRRPYDKQAVFGAVERGDGVEHSKVPAFPIPTNSTQILTGAVKGNVSVKAELLISDEGQGYIKVGREYQHETVKHIQLEYKRKGDSRNIHTNSVEGFWSLFKRGLIGSFHKVSVKHLGRYLNEFEFRFNHRRNEEMFALVILNLVIASAMPYAAFIGKTSQPSDSSEDVPF